MSTRSLDMARLERLAKNRRPTYLAELRACGTPTADGLAFDTNSDCWRALMAAKGAAPHAAGRARAEPVQPVPRDQWPLSVRLIAKRAEPGEAGIGDTVKRLLGENGERFKRIVKRMRMDCRCAARQQNWNLRYPY